MGQVNAWVGTIGGVIIVFELIVLLLILVAINGALVFGLRWVLRKRGIVHEKVTWARALVVRYVDRGANLAAAPVIVTTSVWRGLKVSLYRATHWPAGRAASSATPPPAAQTTAGSLGGPTRAA